MTRTLRFLVLALSPIAMLATGCAGGETSGDDEQIAAESSLTVNQRVERYTAIRSAASARGIGNAFLLAGLATTETGLAQCWSEAQWACQGPNSPECGGGPVIAGSADGPCGDEQGGLGMFQFDAGTYAQTLGRYGRSVLTVDGQIGAAIDYAVAMVRDSEYTTNAETDAKARAWINAFDVNNSTLRNQWIQTVLRYYNGCQPGWNCWNPRFQTYSDGMWTAYNEGGGVAFWGAPGAPVPAAPSAASPPPPAAPDAPPDAPAPDGAAPGNAPGNGPAPAAGGNGTRCGDSPAVVGAIEAKYLQMGGCRSLLGAPVSDEQPTADGGGRYSKFEHGAIYWKQALGAHEVHGQIYDKWIACGAEVGILGYPFGDEAGVPHATGRYSVFEKGSIYWTPALGAHEVHGKIRDAWAESGWEVGDLGYPTSDEYGVAVGRRSDFQNGSITFSANSGLSTIELTAGAASKVLDIDFQIQQTGYWCGPTATHNALSARIDAPSQQQLANELGTTRNGTDWIGQITPVLNAHLDGNPYATTEMPNDPPSQFERDRLWQDVVTSIDNNYPVVANIVAPASNHPPGYPNNTIYHYFTVIGYNADSDEVYIADSANFSGNTLYWIPFSQLATLIPPKGYSAYRP